MDVDPEQLRSDLGAGAADIAEVVSDVRERLPDLQPAPQLEPEQARFRLFDSIAAFLKTTCRHRQKWMNWIWHWVIVGSRLN